MKFERILRHRVQCPQRAPGWDCRLLAGQQKVQGQGLENLQHLSAHPF